MINEERYFEKIKEYRLLAQHDIGQNFLIDPLICGKIVDLAMLGGDDYALEIGPGAGSLSYFIAQKPSRSDLLDIDERMTAKLSTDFEGASNVRILKGNALKWDLTPYTKIIGNLPYYITSSLLEAVLLKATNLKKGVFMVQKEAFARITSKNKEKNYGPLPLLLAYRGVAKKEFGVSRGAFAPSPNVDSVVFSVDIDQSSDILFAQKLYKVTNALFLHRRKTILNNLASFLSDASKAKDFLAFLGINQQCRPEELLLDDYISITRAIYFERR